MSIYGANPPNSIVVGLTLSPTINKVNYNIYTINSEVITRDVNRVSFSQYHNTKKLFQKIRF